MSRRSVVFSAACGVVLAALVYLHLLLNVRTPLIYHQQYPVFLTTLDYFKDFLARPGGGPLKYLSLLASQSFVVPWAGALVIAAMVIRWGG